MESLTEEQILEVAHASNRDQKELVEQVEKKRLVFGIDLDEPEPENESYDPADPHYQH